MEDVKDTLREARHQVAGHDLHVKSRDERIAQTPVDQVRWSGERGASDCYPCDETVSELLQRYGTDHVHYDGSGEPDFRPFETAGVKISDMRGADPVKDRAHNFKLAREKLLKSDWAKKNGIESMAQLKEYETEHGLTWHECSDGVTMRLVPSKINAVFGHSGGVAEMKGSQSLDVGKDGILRTGEKAIAVTGIKARQSGVKITENIDEAAETVSLKASEFIGDAEEFAGQFVDVETLKELNKAGMDSASVAAVYAGTMSIVQNAIKVAKGEEESEDAVKQVIVDTGGAAVTAYATGVLSHALAEQFGGILPGNATMLIATGTFQLSKQVLAYASGELSEEQFKQNVTETAAYMVAAYIGRSVGAAVGAYIPVVGSIVGPVVGEMLATAVCEQVLSAVRFSKQYDKKNAAIISVCRSAEREILESQERLKALIQHENAEFRTAVENGCSMISEGVLGNSCSQVEEGLAVIGGQFGLERSAFQYERTTRQNLFKRRVIVME